MNIEILGKFYDNHSLAIVNRYIALELSKYNNVAITPLDSYDPANQLDKTIVRKLKDLEKTEMESVEIQLRHTYPPVWRWPEDPNTKIVFIQPWEFSKVPMEWQYKWENFADGVICPSDWTSNVYLDGGINPQDVHVIPNGYNPDLFNHEEEESKFFSKDKLTYVFVGNGQHRKGVDLLVNAWKDMFVRADNAQLFIKDSPAIYGENNLLHEIVKVQYVTDCGKIIYNSDNLSELDMANIYKNADVLVHPYRGEGFGMHVLEAAVCGCLPIITDGGPTDEFIPKEISLNIPTGRKFQDLTDANVFATKPGDSLTLMGSHGWLLEPNFDQLKVLLKQIYIHHEKQEVFNKVKNHNFSSYTWDNIGSQYDNVLKEINNNGYKPRRLR